MYGGAFSLWTGRARSYLIKAGIAYREEPHASQHFYDWVLPKAGGRRGIPTIEFPNGDVIRDGVAIVDHFEALNGEAFSPKTPRQKIISLLLDAVGAEGFLRPCMHYRWNFDQDNIDFLLFHFQTIFIEEDSEQLALERMANIKENVNPHWGVTPESHAFIESHHMGTLKKLNAHFSDHPYFLGNKPCRGDFAMMAPLYGHLGRDPAPLNLMQTHAVRLFRWVERMNRPEPDVGEFKRLVGLKNEELDYLPDDQVPQTLIDALKHFAIDFVPESQAACDVINEWLDENKDMTAGTEAARFVGSCHFEVEGVSYDTWAQPFRFYVLKRMQDVYDGLAPADQTEVRAMLDACDMTPLLDMRLTREMGRANNLEVWL
ncbi:MAG: glutathione S-transferase N-terminal domain-containing protein [Pseudomonadales bacterium]